MSDSGKAVFLSYTTDDKAVALAVCEALREGGVEVWMDQSELQGGDAWDAHIHQQLRDCALIIPIISARTQARREGYFRLEWRLADERMRLVAEGTPLIVPVVADETQQKDALVPKSFLTVQWSRLPHGHVPPAFVVRVRRLLGMETSASSATTPAFSVPAELVAMEVKPDETASVTRMERGGGRPAYAPRSLVPSAVTAALALLVGVAATWYLKPSPKSVTPRTEAKALVRFAHDLPASVTYRNTGRSVVAISPDGRSFVYNTTAGLFVRPMDQMEPHVIPGTEAVLVNPIFSPDSQSVAFYASGELRRISVNGGASVVIGAASNPNGMSWGVDGTILYGQPDGIWRVSADGGTSVKIVSSGDGETFFAPQMLPGGRSVLFSAAKSGGGAFQVEVASLSGGGRKIVVPGGTFAHYVPATGHLLYLVENDLFGVAFDAGHLATFGGPVSLVQDVRPTQAATSANYGVSDDGTLIVLSGAAPQSIPAWVDRQGKEEPLKIAPSNYGSLALSPDGNRLALTDNPEGTVGGGSVVVVDLKADALSRLTVGATGGRVPIWTPDGRRVVYDSLDGKLSVKPFNNTRPPEVFVDPALSTTSPVSIASTRSVPSFFTSDGRAIVFTVAGDIAMKSIDPPGPVDWIFKTPFTETAPVLSPDGKWMAYGSNESTPAQVYVSPFPKVEDDRVPVSTDGGRAPVWSRDGKQIFFIGGPSPNERLMSAAVQIQGDKLTVTSRNAVWNRTLRELRYRFLSITRPFEISPDGQRFLMLKEFRSDDAEAAPERIFIIQNWTEELKRRVPVNGK